MYYSDFSQGLMRNPDIINLFTKDFYISPLSLDVDQGNGGQKLALKKGESKLVGDARVRFVDFDFSDVQKGKMVEGGSFTIGVVLEIEKADKKERILPKMKNTGGEIEYIPATSSFAKIEIAIVKIIPDREDPSNSKVELSVRDPAGMTSQKGQETLVVEASIKPFINLVWVGTLTLLLGFIVTVYRRTLEAREKE